MDPQIAWMLKIGPAAIIGLTVHEFAHAYVAFRLGDATAKEQGRLTLNPLKHLDPLGFLLILFAGFGWAKPVQFNAENLQNKHRDEILISVAGPVSNLFLGIFFVVCARLLYAVPQVQIDEALLGVVNLLILWSVVNLGLFIFNLIPLPPLDGSHVYTTYLGDINRALLQKVYRYGTAALLLIVILQSNSKVTILPISELVHVMENFLIDVLGFRA